MKVYLPCQFDLTSCFDFEDIEKHFSFPHYYPKERPVNDNVATFISPGIIIKAPNGRHCKVLNPYFKYLRELRGNQPKLEYTYYDLRQQNRVKEFLSHFPEYSQDFMLYKEKIEEFTRNLYDIYVQTKMLKRKSMSDVDFQLRSHITNLHKIYLEELRPRNNTLQHRGVVKYVNNLAPSLLMYSINYEKRSNVKNMNIKNNEVDNGFNQAACLLSNQTNNV